MQPSAFSKIQKSYIGSKQLERRAHFFQQFEAKKKAHQHSGNKSNNHNSKNNLFNIYANHPKPYDSRQQLHENSYRSISSSKGKTEAGIGAGLSKKSKNKSYLMPGRDSTVPILSKREKEIRDAIEYRYKKSKMRGYTFWQYPKEQTAEESYKKIAMKPVVREISSYRSYGRREEFHHRMFEDVSSDASQNITTVKIGEFMHPHYPYQEDLNSPHSKRNLGNSPAYYANREPASPTSEDMPQYSHLKMLKYFNLRQFHEFEEGKRKQAEQKSRGSFKNRLNIRTETSSILLREDSSRSKERSTGGSNKGNQYLDKSFKSKISRSLLKGALSGGVRTPDISPTASSQSRNQMFAKKAEAYNRPSAHNRRYCFDQFRKEQPLIIIDNKSTNSNRTLTLQTDNQYEQMGKKQRKQSDKKANKNKDAYSSQSGHSKHQRSKTTSSGYQYIEPTVKKILSSQTSTIPKLRDLEKISRKYRQ